ncbi:MAG TPA: hypothetical protein VN673_12300 [Clostridia bacterium]|nr:hypothetical protein [Clostridia bacterium]
MLIERKGKPNHEWPKPTANLSTAESARVIRSLLVRRMRVQVGLNATALLNCVLHQHLEGIF